MRLIIARYSSASARCSTPCLSVLTSTGRRRGHSVGSLGGRSCSSPRHGHSPSVSPWLPGSGGAHGGSYPPSRSGGKSGESALPLHVKESGEMARRDSANEVSQGHAHGQPYPRTTTPETGRGGVWPSPPHLECGDRRFESCRPDQTPEPATLSELASFSGSRQRILNPQTSVRI